ncbi:MAG: hypothetical protein AVDCRST_MAG45-1554, partial [uncultured Solirubrobacterales bacterium]
WARSDSQGSRPAWTRAGSWTSSWRSNARASTASRSPSSARRPGRPGSRTSPPSSRRS